MATELLLPLSSSGPLSPRFLRGGFLINVYKVFCKCGDEVLRESVLKVQIEELKKGGGGGGATALQQSGHHRAISDI